VSPFAHPTTFIRHSIKCTNQTRYPFSVRRFISFVMLELLGAGQLSRYSDWLRAERSGDRIPVGAIFSAPDQIGPGANPASYTMGAGSFQGLKRPGRGVDHPLPSSAEVKERVVIPLPHLWAFVARSGVTFTFNCRPSEAKCMRSVSMVFGTDVSKQLSASIFRVKLVR